MGQILGARKVTRPTDICQARALLCSMEGETSPKYVPQKHILGWSWSSCPHAGHPVERYKLNLVLFVEVIVIPGLYDILSDRIWDWN